MELEEADVNATNGTKMTQARNPVICHICGKKHYKKRCPYREESASDKKAEKVEDIPNKESAPKKPSINVTIEEDWGDNTDCSNLMLFQVTAEITTDKNLNMEYQHTLSQSGGNMNPTWVLLDNQSTVEVFSNRRILKNIRKSDRELEIFFTGGQTTTNIKEDLISYGTVWFHPGGIYNILSLSKVAEKYRVAYDIAGEYSKSRQRSQLTKI